MIDPEWKTGFQGLEKFNVNPMEGDDDKEEGYMMSTEEFADRMKNKTGEASQPPKSGSTIDKAAMLEEVRQIIRAEFARGLKGVGISPKPHRLHLETPIPSAQSDRATQSHSVINLVTSSTNTPSLSEPVIIPGSPVSVATTF